MTLSCTSPFQKRSFGPGIYINEVTIADVADISGQQLPFLTEPVDIGIKLFLDIGRDFQPEMIVAGNLKRDPDTGEVIGWGSAFVLQDALSKLGFTGNLEEGNRIPLDALEGLIGKKFLRLSYVSGLKPNDKPRYSDWSQIGTVEEGPDALAARFKRSLQKGYPRNYRPHLLEEATIVPASQVVTEGDPF